MPLPPNFKLPKPEQIKPLPDDTYQVVIKDISTTEGKNFNTGEPETQLEFTFQVLDEGEHHGKILKKWVTPKYAPQKGNKQESNLHAIVVKTLKREPTPDDLHLHDLFGKQLRVVVSTYTSNAGFLRNKIEGYLPIKEELPLIEKEQSEEPVKKPVIAGKEDDDQPPASTYEQDIESTEAVEEVEV